MLNKMFLLIFAVSTILLISCNPEPTPIQYGKDNCEYCRMLISDTKYGAELITKKGKIFKYDSIECLAAYSNEIDQNEIHSMWVVNFSRPNELININDSQFLLSDNLKSPMGLYLSAYKDGEQLAEIQKQFGGKIIVWKELVDYVIHEWN